MRAVIVKSAVAAVVFAIMVGGFLYYVASLGIRVSPPTARTNVSLQVSDVNNIVPDSNVLLRGVSIGKVSSVETTLDKAIVHFYIENKYQVPANSIFRLENLSALGESYIEVEPQSTGGPSIAEGSVVPADLVRQPASISELGTGVVRVMNQLDPQQLQQVINDADAALPDPYVVLPNLSRAGTLLRSTTADLNGRGGQALENVQSLLEHAGFIGPAIADATPSLREFTAPLIGLWNGGSENVFRIQAPQNIFVFGKFLQRLQKLIDDRGTDIRVLTEPLMANINAIAAALRTVDTGAVLGNLLDAVPADGTINLHVSNPQG